MMSESDPPDGKDNGAVGYRRPPVDRQFKPGQSGNPKGRPKGSKNFVTTFAAILSRPIKVRDRNNGKTRTASKLEVMIEAITNKAMAGDAKAFATVIQYADKFQVFKAQMQNYPDAVASLREKLAQQILRLGMAPPTSPEAPTQGDANLK
jgi:Family of unknown function (DUF5681)